MSKDSDTEERPRGDYYSHDELRKRGWTDEEIEEQLGAFDIRGVNPHHEGGSQVHFYLKERVLRVEQSGPEPPKPKESEPITTDRHTFTTEQIANLLDGTIDLFMEYQYKHGYEEPKARVAAIQAILERLVPSH